MEVKKVLMGSYLLNQFQIEVIGGTVGDITEIVSESFQVKVGDEMVLFMKKNPMQIVNSNEGAFLLQNGKVNLGTSSVEVSEFVNALYESKQMKGEIHTLHDILKIIDEKKKK